LDSAVFFGINKPASWPAAIVPGAVAAGNVVTWPAAGTGPEMVDAIDDLMSTVENDGFDVNGFVTYRGFRGALRKLRDANGVKLLDIANSEYEGAGIRYAMDGLWPDVTALSAARMVAGDFTKGVIGIRKDITYEIFREGVITDNSTPPQIIFNLMQQDMVAMRVTFRVAWQVANPISYANTNAGTRYPFGVLRNAAA
jgi:HK97 family phage major capsid protein